MNIETVVKLVAVLVSSLFVPLSVAKADETKEPFSQSQYEELVRRLSYNPDDILAGDTLRDYCRKSEMSDKCIDSLNGLVKSKPKNKYLRYHAALAYVDKVPGHSLFRQGWLSSRSMSHMSAVIKQDEQDWTAYYIRGVNGLHWPRSFRKLPGSKKDLEFCIELSSKLPKGLVKPYHGLAYIALGDAFVKNNELSEALSIYKKGSDMFVSSQLEARLGMKESELKDYIKKYRHTDQRLDTELSFLVDGGANKL